MFFFFFSLFSYVFLFFSAYPLIRRSGSLPFPHLPLFQSFGLLVVCCPRPGVLLSPCATHLLLIPPLFGTLAMSHYNSFLSPFCFLTSFPRPNIFSVFWTPMRLSKGDFVFVGGFPGGVCTLFSDMYIFFGDATARTAAV